MTPIETALAPTISSSLSYGRIVSPATASPIRFGSASSSATTRKPRDTKPE
jgi:hypothetical protein